MNYQIIYNRLMTRGRNRQITGYAETHHIVPRCMGGTNEEDNLVRLTPEEHYVAHQLLVKIYPKNNALVKAAAMMVPNRPSNKLYGWLRRRLAETMSISQTGEKNSQFGTRWIHSTHLKESKKIPKLDPLPIGWEEGRRINFGPSRKEIRIEEQRRRQEAELLALREMMHYYRDNDISMRELTQKFGVGHNVYTRFERYFKEEYQEIVKNKKGNSNVAKGRYKGA